MRTFYLVSEGQQSLLMISLFLTLILFLLLQVVTFGNRCDRRKRYLHVSASLLLFALLVLLADAFDRINRGFMPEIWLPVPVALIWCMVGAAVILFVWEMIGLHRTKGQTLNRNAVKEAMDQLPGGICYFNRSGSVKLCNLQMHRLFRTLTQKDLQQLSELEEALNDCGPDTGVICLSKELQNYLFPDGRAWRFRKSQVRDEEGTPYTEVVFSDLTEQYERGLELKKQTKALKEISRKLRRLSENALILTREKEVLAAKTRLHDQMGAGLTAVRQILLHQKAAGAAYAAKQPHQGWSGTESAVKLLRQAVSAVKNDNEYPPEKDELAKLIQDAETIGVKVSISGTLPESEELSFVFLIAMRECLSNGVRHAGATELWIAMQEEEDSVSIHITNNGTPPEGEIVPKGGLHNLYRYVLDCGGRMEIQSEPSFALTITLPKEKEEQA